MRLCLLAVVAFLWMPCVPASAAQSPAAAPSHETSEPATSFGTVTGHITIAGSNVPARLASFGLQPVEIKPPEASVSGKRPSTILSVYQTGLDGSYSLSHVVPGKYYLVVTQAGFLSPFDEFTRAELEHPTGPVQQRIDSTLPVVLVRPNATTTYDLQLQHGAGLGGAVRFDDGTPFAQANVSLLRRDAEGKWVTPRTSSYTSAGDDGHWHISGLPAGDYCVRVDLNLTERKQSSLLGDNGAMVMRPVYSLLVYNGDTTRERDAKLVTLTDGQDMSGVDINIPVARLHAVTGSVVDARTGQAVNNGRVELVYADDGKSLTYTDVEYETGTFTFRYVPEGEYKLLVKSAKQVRRDAAFVQEFSTALPKSTTLREYSPAEMPLSVVAADRSGVTLPVEETPMGSRSKTGSPSTVTPQ